MAAYYLDSSALVKRYIHETGSRFITTVTDRANGNDAWVATITSVEIIAALYRRVRTGTIRSPTAASAEQIFRQEMVSLFLPWDLAPSILAHAMTLTKAHSLRAYDAIQLATAVDLHVSRNLANFPKLTFLSADQPLNQAALAEGLLVDDPNRYP